jgi:hypothetical protein
MELFNSLIMLVSTNVAICGRLKQSKNLLQKLFVSDYYISLPLWFILPIFIN